jgi:DTW domain-containing protein YfiP
MADELVPPRPGRCPRCFLQEERCVCAEIPRVDTDVHIAIVRHWREVAKHSNTGRFAHLALPNSSLHSVGRKDDRIDEAALTAGNTWLLFPEGTPLHANAPTPRVDRLVVLDGTWHQARRMRQRLGCLRGLPILRLPPTGVVRERLRKSPTVDGLSTLEAIAGAIARLEGAAAGDALLALYDEVVRRSISGHRTDAARWGYSHHGDG